jgi:hypothetical protein
MVLEFHVIPFLIRNDHNPLPFKGRVRVGMGKGRVNAVFNEKWNCRVALDNLRTIKLEMELEPPHWQDLESSCNPRYC